MLTYCSGCKKHDDNICPKKLILMINKENKNEDKKKIKHINELEIIVSQFLID